MTRSACVNDLSQIVVGLDRSWPSGQPKRRSCCRQAGKGVAGVDSDGDGDKYGEHVRDGGGDGHDTTAATIAKTELRQPSLGGPVTAVSRLETTFVKRDR